MSIEILVPDLPESVADASVATWHKQPGDIVERDEILVDIETDKVVLEVPAPDAGVLVEILEEEGATVLSKQLLAKLKPGVDAGDETNEKLKSTTLETSITAFDDQLSPAVRRQLAENDIDPKMLKGTGKGGRISKEDIDAYVQKQKKPIPTAIPVEKSAASPVTASGRSEKRVPMTRLRKRIAERLLEAKNSTAMLTTFNEVNMKPIMDLRKQYKETFEQRHNVRLGFMSFYVKAVVEALKRYPEINASLDGDDVVYHNYFDISMAVSTPRGLVTPVLRDCDKLNMAEIEQGIKDLAFKGRDGKLTVDDLTGGNFTITNGGVFGSLMSTPIINPPQSAILGMHKIQDRAMAVDGEVVILPMMYLALSYDHRVVDGKESVGFLVTIKELLEDPTRLLLEI